MTSHGTFIGTSKQPRIYRIWRAMRFRCTNPTHQDYPSYGGRGIKVCEEWSDFATFQSWAMAAGYTDDLTIDRIDNSGNYHPDNCRWVPMAVQNENKRRAKSELLVERNGETKNLREWATETGIYYTTLHRRFMRGVRGEALFAPPVEAKRRTVKKRDDGGR